MFAQAGKTGLGVKNAKLCDMNMTLYAMCWVNVCLYGYCRLCISLLVLEKHLYKYRYLPCAVETQPVYLDGVFNFPFRKIKRPIWSIPPEQ